MGEILDCDDDYGGGCYEEEADDEHYCDEPTLGWCCFGIAGMWRAAGVDIQGDQFLEHHIHYHY